MTETGIMQRIRVALSKGAGRVFRNNTGQAWTGNATRLKDGSVLIRDPRPFHAGLCKGSADLIGWRSLEITPDMVGRNLAVFVSVEVKGPKGRATPEQIAWRDAVAAAGGFAGIARSVEDAEQIISPTNKQNGLAQ